MCERVWPKHRIASMMDEVMALLLFYGLTLAGPASVQAVEQGT